jgi:hypothetical protein
VAHVGGSGCLVVSLRLGGEYLALALFTPLKQNKEKEF